jgi:hypothetical protein
LASTSTRFGGGDWCLQPFSEGKQDEAYPDLVDAHWFWYDDVSSLPERFRSVGYIGAFFVPVGDDPLDILGYSQRNTLDGRSTAGLSYFLILLFSKEVLLCSLCEAAFAATGETATGVGSD